MTLLEDYLDGYEGIVIAVSHDRYFWIGPSGGFLPSRRGAWFSTRAAIRIMP